MCTRSGWAVLLGAALALTLGGLQLIPRRPAVVHVIVEEVDPSLLDRIPVNGLEPREERRFRRALLPKFSERCALAFEEAGLVSPLELALTRGFVVHSFRDLWLKDKAALGLVYEQTMWRYQSEFSSGQAQAGTVPAERYGWRLTVDGRARIFIHDSAFAGESFWFRRYLLEDVITHELMHAGGQPVTRGWLGFLTHDLAGFEPHDRILEACR